MNWLTVVMFIVYMLSILAGMVVAHELGHLWAFKRITGKLYKIRWHWNGLHSGFKVGNVQAGDYTGLTEEQYRAVIYAGIGVGFLLEVCLFPFLISEDFAILIAAIYLFGCKEDLLGLIHSYKREGKTMRSLFRGQA